MLNRWLEWATPSTQGLRNFKVVFSNLLCFWKAKVILFSCWWLNLWARAIKHGKSRFLDRMGLLRFQRSCFIIFYCASSQNKSSDVAIFIEIETNWSASSQKKKVRLQKWMECQAREFKNKTTRGLLRLQLQNAKDRISAQTI